MQTDALRRKVSFGLTSEQCELLLAFELTGSLTELASVVGRDISVVSRALQKIALATPVLEKQQGKWQLSRLGREINNWTREAAEGQKRVLSQQTILRIASTREFAARILAPALGELAKDAPGTLLSVTTHEDGVERVLLAGEADIGFDCGRPEDSAVRFRQVQPESFAIVASPAFIRRHKPKGRDELLALPHLQTKRATALRLLRLSYEVPNVVATFNDLAVMREACAAGLGWCVLPLYAVRREIKEGSLKTIEGWPLDEEKFGVWWLRSRTSLAPWVGTAVKWLSAQKLS